MEEKNELQKQFCKNKLNVCILGSRDCEQATNGMAAFVLSGQPNGCSTSNDY